MPDRRNSPLVVFVSYYLYQPEKMQQVVKNVFAKEIAKQCRLIFLLYGEKKQGNKQSWYASEVWLSRWFPGGGLREKLLTSVYSVRRFWQIFRLVQKETDVIVLVRDLPGIMFFCTILKKFFSFRLYFQYSAPLGAISLASVSKVSITGRMIPFFKGSLHQFFLKPSLEKADIVFPITVFFEDELKKRYSIKKAIPLTMGVDNEWAKQLPVPIEFLEQWCRGYTVIGYFGALGLMRNSVFMLDTLVCLIEKISNVKLILMGSFPNDRQKEHFTESIKKLQIEKHVMLTGSLPTSQLRNYLAYCHITLSAIPPEPHYVISSPTKLYESLALGIPVVASRGILEHEKVIKESNGGLLADYQADKFADALEILCLSPEKRRQMGEMGRSYVLKNYDYKTIAQKISPFFSKRP